MHVHPDYSPRLIRQPSQPSRARVEALEREIEKLPQVDCPVRHYFAPGLYAREMTIPAGVAAVGAVHKTEHLTVVSKGVLLLTTDDGMRKIEAPATFVSKAGIKRAAYAVEDAVITTFHATDETDLDRLCELLTESRAAELIGGCENRQMLRNRLQERK
jgi:hypothetical protein